MLNPGLVIRKTIPGVDPVVAEYTSGYVKHLTLLTTDAVGAASLDLSREREFLTSVLVSAGGAADATAALVAQFTDPIATALEANRAKLALTGDTSQRLLDRLFVLQREAQALLLGAVADIEHTGRKMESRVDKKALEKAERKIARKVAKRNNKFVQYEALRLIAPEQGPDYDSFFLEINPIDFRGSGKSKDIAIDTFDLYVGAGQRVLLDASLQLAFGHRYGLVGQNGIGKLTLLRALLRRELNVPKHILILHVEQEIRGDETSALQLVLDADVWRKLLLQEEESVRERVNEIERLKTEFDEDSSEARKLDAERDDLEQRVVGIQAQLVEMESDKAEARAAQILHGLGFTRELQHQATNTFSGGWRMRLSLARALFCKPDLLLLDEPLNMLDVPSITYLALYLQTYPATVLVVSHDRSFLNDVATDIIHQHLERLDYYRGADFESFYNTRTERLKTARREWENQMAYRQHLQEFIDKFRYNAAKSLEAQLRIKKLEKLPVLEEPEEEKEVQFKFPDPDNISPPILQLLDVSFGYTKDKMLLLHVELDVQMDLRIALVGANGCGKTTLLKILLETERPLSGFVNKNGRLRIGYFAQHHIDGMDLSKLAVAWMAYKFPGKTDEEYRRHLGSFGITGTLGLQKMELLSGGQKLRVAFAVLCLSQPHILVLDEPSNHLDTQGLDALADALAQFKGGVLMVSHDVAMIQRVCNEIWVSEEGTVKRFEGTIQDYKTYILAKADSRGVVAKH